MNMLQRIFSRSWHPGRATIAGMVALGAYTVEMEADMAVTGNRFSDVRFIEGLLPVGADSSRPSPIGTIASRGRFIAPSADLSAPTGLAHSSPQWSAPRATLRGSF